MPNQFCSFWNSYVSLFMRFSKVDLKTNTIFEIDRQINGEALFENHNICDYFVRLDRFEEATVAVHGKTTIGYICCVDEYV